MSLFVDYFVFAFLLFFISFFIDVFYQYFRYRRIVPRKMFTYKPGGLFEHYRIVGFILLVLVLLHTAFGLNPFATGEDATVLSVAIEIATFYIPLTIFFIFVFIFLMYLFFSLYSKAKNIEDRKEYLASRGHMIIVVSFILGVAAGTSLLLWILLNALPE